MNNIFYEYPEKILKIKIIGVLEDNARIIGYTKNTYRNTRDYRDIPINIINKSKYIRELYASLICTK